jgi:hypothetical protein
MTNKGCRNTRREIDELELGHRPGAEATAHMAACSACEKFHAERKSLRELVGGLEPVIAPPDFDMRLRARIAAEKYDKRAQPFFVRLVSTPALAAAALFVIVAGSVVWISRRPSTPTVTPTRPEVAKTNETIAPAKVNQAGGTDDVTRAPDKGRDVASADINRHRSRGRGVSSEDQFSRPAPVISQADSDQAYVPSRPVEFALQDGSGKTRRISLPAVSFGGQNLVGNNRTNVSYPQTSRVW